jgi:peptidoglycan/xylan/chitin deacetylase (PgdA/CDA1 family)
VSADESVPPERDKGSEVFLPVIMYHAVSVKPSKAGEYIITPKMFESDMEYLAAEGYTSVSAEDVLKFVRYGAPLPKRPVLITFDDGHSGVFHYLKPTIERMNLKVTLNIVGDYTDRETDAPDRSPEYSSMSWSELGELVSDPLFEVGSHTYSMHNLNGSRLGCKRRPGESSEAYRSALSEDAGKLQAAIRERLGVTPIVFAYPFGFISEESKPILSGLGLNVLLTCFERPNYISEGMEAPVVLNRYNRSGLVSTETYMKRLLRR